MCDVSSSQNLQLREIQWPPQRHSACKGQNRDWIPRSSNSESFFAPEIKLFALSHAFVLHEHLHFRRKVNVQGKENIFCWKNYLKNRIRMIKMSMVPRVVPCTAKVIPVSNTQKEIGQILKLSCFYCIRCHFMLPSTAERV